MLDHTITVREETVEKAIEKGLEELAIDRDQAEIHVISEGKRGLFGFGKQDAIVEVTRKNNLSFKEITQQLEAEQVEKEEFQALTEVDKEIVEPIESVEESEIQTYGDFVEDKDKQENEEDENQDFDENQEGLSIEASSQKVAVYIDEVIKAYGAQSDTEFEVHGSQVTFNIDTDKSGLVIGKHGKIINSLQVLSHTLLQSYYRKRVSVLLNVGDYRDRRANVLEQIADRTADEVLRTKQTVILDPLPAYERKQIHARLAEYEHIRTHSEGKEPNRYLVVEYE